MHEWITLLSIYNREEPVFRAGFRYLTPKGISADVFTHIVADTGKPAYDLKALGTRNCAEEKSACLHSISETHRLYFVTCFNTAYAY